MTRGGLSDRSNEHPRYLIARRRAYRTGAPEVLRIRLSPGEEALPGPLGETSLGLAGVGRRAFM